jgi:hypothetical protein
VKCPDEEQVGVSTQLPVDPRSPRFVATVVGVLSVVALYGYAATTAVLTTGTVSFVLLAVLLPTVTAYWLARLVF